MALKKWTFICDCGKKTDMGIIDDTQAARVQTFCGDEDCGKGLAFYPSTVSYKKDPRFLIEEIPEPPKKKPVDQTQDNPGVPVLQQIKGPKT